MKEGLGRSRSLPTIVKTERLLLETYFVKLPDNSEVEHTLNLCDVSSQILQAYQPVMCQTHKPVYSIGDGHCLYRSISLALYGTQEYHLHLRLLIALEMLEDRVYYDGSKETCAKMLQFDVFPTVTAESYRTLMDSVCSTSGDKC